MNTARRSTQPVRQATTFASNMLKQNILVFNFISNLTTLSTI